VRFTYLAEESHTQNANKSGSGIASLDKSGIVPPAFISSISLDLMVHLRDLKIDNWVVYAAFSKLG
jgi:hypothetical protein